MPNPAFPQTVVLSQRDLYGFDGFGLDDPENAAAGTARSTVIVLGEFDESDTRYEDAQYAFEAWSADYEENDDFPRFFLCVARDDANAYVVTCLPDFLCGQEAAS